MTQPRQAAPPQQPAQQAVHPAMRQRAQPQPPPPPQQPQQPPQQPQQAQQARLDQQPTPWRRLDAVGVYAGALEWQDVPCTPGSRAEMAREVASMEEVLGRCAMVKAQLQRCNQRLHDALPAAGAHVPAGMSPTAAEVVGQLRWEAAALRAQLEQDRPRLDAIGRRLQALRQQALRRMASPAGGLMADRACV